ncbi:alpha/beta fold hydrolase [Halomarina ordinaria]|uniref:Alpha/beta fold hydrolase n=1 Tax=Halomarina ordinaria TaxID=3033939 RepID=A0ABD5U5G3_9EURY|nr:alpha/beta fold hydrolase [Halomarina sp. PSRA2]
MSDALGDLDGHPFVRVDGEGTPLVVVVGLNDPLLRVTDALWFAASVAALGRRLRRRGYPGPVYLLSRPVGLPRDATTRTLAADLGEVLDANDLAPANLLGLSMGGFLVQHLAADRPDLVERAVCGLAADRLSPHGRRTVERWRAWGAAGEWGRIYRAGSDVVAVGALRRLLRAGTYPYERLASVPPAAVDFDVSARASLAHDAGDRLASVDAPTLVVGGTRDPFFSERAFRRTADGLHDGRFVRLDGLGHEAVICAGERFDRPVVDFLAP